MFKLNKYTRKTEWVYFQNKLMKENFTWYEKIINIFLIDLHFRIDLILIFGRENLVKIFLFNWKFTVQPDSVQPYVQAIVQLVFIFVQAKTILYNLDSGCPFYTFVI